MPFFTLKSEENLSERYRIVQFSDIQINFIVNDENLSSLYAACVIKATRRDLIQNNIFTDAARCFVFFQTKMSFLPADCVSKILRGWIRIQNFDRNRIQNVSKICSHFFHIVL